ncbi:prohead protease/major capsid protein fusion protein [Azospirillum brasilense]|uniref:prohead protease/major capsid protein fusion protein n=1 Tax=Azospirillum brasilense TaxID=192 RepID=UPI000E0CB302|nr:prohead protease/major capsid protein fusion protein [Azospirillum brasilense]
MAEALTRAMGATTPTTLNREARTVEVVALSGPAPAVRPAPAPDGTRSAWVEELDAAGADLSRFRGGPALKDHRNTTDAAVGTVAVAQIDGDRIAATVRFDTSATAEDLIAKVEAGSVRGVSLGYSVQRWQRAGKRDGLPVFRAIAWAPHELSFTPVPVDAGATVRSAGGSMDDDTTTEADATAEATTDISTRAADTSATANRAGINGQIRTMVRAAGLDVATADRLIDDGADLDRARAAVFDAMLARSGTRPLAAVQVLHDHDDPGNVVDRMATAFAARATAHLPEAHRVQMPEQARSYAGRSLLDLAAELADRRGNPIGTRHLSPADLYQRAMTTGDFPVLLANAANKTLLPAYQAAAPTYRRFFARRDFRDFKPASFARVGDFPVPLAVGENGEYKHGAISESGESVTLGEYGRVVMFSRKALINDDLSAFADLPTKAALRCADWENSVAWALVVSNPVLSDGKALFHASHGNLAASGAAIDLGTVSAGEAAMMKQTSLDGLKLNLKPSVLATGPDQFTAARQFVSTAVAPTTAAAVNPLAGKLEPVGDANLPGPGWYMMAEPSALETFIYGYLQGQSGPVITPEPGFDVAGVKVKLTIDFAVGAVDYRGAYYNPGA